MDGFRLLITSSLTNGSLILRQKVAIKDRHFSGKALSNRPRQILATIRMRKLKSISLCMSYGQKRRTENSHLEMRSKTFSTKNWRPRAWYSPLRIVSDDAAREGKGYELSYDENLARDRALGELKATLGADVVKGLGNDPKAVTDFLSQSGGIEANKLKSPGNNAIKSLLALGIPVTPKKIKALIEGTNGTGIVEPGTKVTIR